MGNVRAGAMKCVITPPIGLPLAGCRTIRIASGKKDELFARAFVLEGKQSLAIVCVDTLAIDAASVSRIRKDVQEKIPIPGNNILICASHTHTAAATVPIFDTIPDADYLKNFEAIIAGTVIGAWNRRKNAIVKQGKGEEGDISFNRRVILKDGSVIIGGLEDETPLETIEKIEGGIDPEVNVLSIEDDDGNIIAVVADFACHADIVTGNEYSADYPFYVEQAVCRLLNSDFPVLLLTGAGADINNHNVMNPDSVKTRSRYFDPLGLAKCKTFSNILAAEIAKTALKANELSIDQISIQNNTIDIPLRKPTDHEIKWAKEKLSQRNASVKDRITASEIFRLKNLEQSEKTAKLEIQIIRLDKVIIIAIPCEVFTKIGLDIKNLFPDQNVFISELANGYEGYMITQEAYLNGGYEAQSAFSSKLSELASNYIVDSIRESDLKELIYNEN